MLSSKPSCAGLIGCLNNTLWTCPVSSNQSRAQLHKHLLNFQNRLHWRIVVIVAFHQTRLTTVSMDGFLDWTEGKFSCTLTDIEKERKRERERERESDRRIRSNDEIKNCITSRSIPICMPISVVVVVISLHIWTRRHWKLKPQFVLSVNTGTIPLTSSRPNGRQM